MSRRQKMCPPSPHGFPRHPFPFSSGLRLRALFLVPGGLRVFFRSPVVRVLGVFSGCVSCALLGAPGSLRGNLLVLQKGEVGGPRALLFGEPIASFADVSPVSSQSTSQSIFGCPRCVEMLYLFGVRQRVASTECFAGLQRKNRSPGGRGGGGKISRRTPMVRPRSEILPGWLDLAVRFFPAYLDIEVRSNQHR